MVVKYRDLEIELSRCCCGQREVRILESPVDRPRDRLTLEDSALRELQSEIDQYGKLLLQADGSARALELARVIGNRLFALLTVGRVGGSLREALLLLDLEREHSNVGWRLRFSFGQSAHYDPDIANLPWELICDPRGGGRFLGREPQTQVVRYLDVTRKIKPLEVRPPLRILAILASPREQRAINLDAQELQLRRAIGEHRQDLELQILRPPTLRALRETLTRAEDSGRPIHVLHFLGHGELTESGDGAFYFERDDRSQHVVRSQVLAAQLSNFRHLRLVVLATCAGGRLPREQGKNPFTGGASALIAANIPAVVAMQFNVTEQAASAFTSAFYKKLRSFKPVDEAVAEGRLAINSNDVDGCEWATPVLFLRSPDGAIFRQRPVPEDRGSATASNWREGREKNFPSEGTASGVFVSGGRLTADQLAVGEGSRNFKIEGVVQGDLDSGAIPDDPADERKAKSHNES